ncbi:MAG: hypothetical protein M3357_00050, partial [Actinomycetota bacterium]|nr:hypothetical protein [Actinomycetota bacterium]
VTAASPADDGEGFEALADFLEELFGDGLLELPEDVLEELVEAVTEPVEVLVCVSGRALEDILPPPTTTTTAPTPPATSPPGPEPCA